MSRLQELPCKSKSPICVDVPIDQPARYGFHATLKAPFPLRLDADADAFFATVGQLAQSTASFDLPPLTVDWLGEEGKRFLALRPTVEPGPSHALRRLADRCVRELDVWRRPPSPAELERRVAGIDANSRPWMHALRWGYPFVMDSWRFHMTLSDPMSAWRPQQDPAAALRAACAHFDAALSSPVRCRSICIFVESEPGAPFHLERRFALAA